MYRTVLPGSEPLPLPGGGPAVQVPQPLARSLPPGNANDPDLESRTSGTADEVAFTAAMERYVRHHDRYVLTPADVLLVIRALGFRRVDPPARKPPRPPSE